MKKEDCKIHLSWDYKIPNNYENMVEVQSEWNQTLTTKINQASAQIHMTTLRGPADRVKVNSDTLKLIETFEYYDNITNKIHDRFLVIIDDELLDNEVFVYNEKELNENLFITSCDIGETIQINEFETETEILDAKFKLVSTSSEEEINEHKKKLCVYIQIINR